MLARHRVLAVLRADNANAALEAANVLIDAGVGAVEVTFTVPNAAEVIDHLARSRPEALVGAGTVTSPAHVQEAVDAGAAFLVSPGASPALLGAMIASGLPSVPGTFTASEMMTAHSAGAAAVKLFPAGALGPAHLDQLRGPLPNLAVVPSGGIGIEDVPVWLAHGALAVGLGSLATPADIAARDWPAVRAKAARVSALMPPDTW